MECPDQLCNGEGWFFYKNKLTNKYEVRRCDVCNVFTSDEAAGDFAINRCNTAINIADVVTEVRADDSQIKRATAKAFGESRNERRQGEPRRRPPIHG